MSKLSRWSKRTLQSTSELLHDVRCVVSGVRAHRLEGQTSPEAYQSLRRLFRSTNGRFNDAVGQWCKARHPKRPMDLQGCLFEDATSEEVQSVGTRLRRDGVYKFPRLLPEPLCNHLLQLALDLPGRPVASTTQREPCVFDREQPQSVRHQFDANQLFESDVVQALATDPYFFHIAQEYFGFNPVQDLMAMWWSAPGDAELQSRAAQLYHFDMDRFKFVKFFVYLTDVGPDNGPHCYIRGSHRRKPSHLLRDQRISDEEIAEHYPAKDRLELTGPQGTLLAVDTRGFHKGKPLVVGDRLIFQLQFADSMFGQNYPPVRIPETLATQVRERMAANTRCYSNFKRPQAA